MMEMVTSYTSSSKASYTGDDTEKLGHTRKQSESLLLVSIVKGRE